MYSTPEFEALNSVKYLYLRELSEPKDNSLRLVIAEAVDNRSASSLALGAHPDLATILSDTWPIETIEGCRTFELHWKHYVAYLVTEELVGSSGHTEHEIFTGELFRVYTKSNFLDHLLRDTGAHTEPIQHFKTICLNHLIDVASYALPEIRLLSSPQMTQRIQ